MEASGGDGRSPGAEGRGAWGRKASGGRSGLVRGLHPGARVVSPSGPIITLHHVMPKGGNQSQVWPLRLMRLIWLSQEASHNPKDNHQEYINRVSDMNSKKEIKIPFIMAKIKKIQKFSEKNSKNLIPKKSHPFSFALCFCFFFISITYDHRDYEEFQCFYFYVLLPPIQDYWTSCM